MRAGFQLRNPAGIFITVMRLPAGLFLGHVVLLQRIGDGLLRGLAPEAEDVGVGGFEGGGGVVWGLFLLHLRLRN